MKRRERVMNSLNFLPVDHIAKDLSAMASTGISCFAYPKLVEYLGLPKRQVRVWDTGQMLALPDLDVLDALDCDVVRTNGITTNAFPQPEIWKPYDFNGRLENGAVLYPENFTTLSDGTIKQLEEIMPPTAVVFNREHAGEPFNPYDDFPHEDLVELQKELDEFEIDDREIEKLVAHCKKVRESTDRAVMFDGLNCGLGFYGGMVQWSMMCLLEPEYVKEFHKIKIGFAKKKYEKIIPSIAPYIDIILSIGDDMGTQNSLIISPELCKELYFDFYKEINDIVHAKAPHVKTFIHSCGAVYDILDTIADSGFDILNPVQWSAGNHSYNEWKDKARNRMTLWGGAIDAQHTLPLKSLDEIKKEVLAVGNCFIEDSGVVFNNTHNILAEITPERIMAMYDTAKLIKAK